MMIKQHTATIENMGEDEKTEHIDEKMEIIKY